jgi:hypothetical protein
MKDLPEYFAIRQDDTNQLWLKYIKWLNKTFKTNWKGDNYRSLYGYDGGVVFNGTQSLQSMTKSKRTGSKKALSKAIIVKTKRLFYQAKILK